MPYHLTTNWDQCISFGMVIIIRVIFTAPTLKSCRHLSKNAMGVREGIRKQYIKVEQILSLSLSEFIETSLIYAHAQTFSSTHLCLLTVMHAHLHSHTHPGMGAHKHTHTHTHTHTQHTFTLSRLHNSAIKMKEFMHKRTYIFFFFKLTIRCCICCLYFLKSVCDPLKGNCFPLH